MDKKTITVDFDGTLSRHDVQEFVKELMNEGINVWVLTSRYDDLHKHRYPHNPTNEDLYKVTDKLGIHRGNIRFQCMRPKAEYLRDSNVVLHLDDDFIELYDINRLTNTIPVDVNLKNYKKQIKNILEL